MDIHVYRRSVPSMPEHGLWIVGILLIIVGSTMSEPNCEFSEFRVCLEELLGSEMGIFSVVSEEDMNEICTSKRQAIECTSNYVENCMKKGLKELYESTTGSKLKVLEEMCNKGTAMNKGYLENMECFDKIRDEISFCQDKYKESQEVLSKAKILDRLKLFHGCCGLEWHRKCLEKTVGMKCGKSAASFAYSVVTRLGGEAQEKMCSSSYSSCHGLYGVNVEDEEQQMMTDASDTVSIPWWTIKTSVSFLLCVWLCILVAV